jgi:hypothetical protein
LATLGQAATAACIMLFTLYRCRFWCQPCCIFARQALCGAEEQTAVIQGEHWCPLQQPRTINPNRLFCLPGTHPKPATVCRQNAGCSPSLQGQATRCK